MCLHFFFQLSCRMGPAGALSPAVFSSCLRVHLSASNHLPGPARASTPSASGHALPRLLPDYPGPSFPIREFPYWPLHPGRLSPDVRSPQVVWCHKPEGAWGCPRPLCSIFRYTFWKTAGEVEYIKSSFALSPGKPHGIINGCCGNMELALSGPAASHLPLFSILPLAKPFRSKKSSWLGPDLISPA